MAFRVQLAPLWEKKIFFLRNWALYLDVDCPIFLTNLVHPFFRFDIQVYHLIYWVYYFQCHLHFLKNWYNDYKYVIPGISHEKLGLKKCFSLLPISMLNDKNLLIFECHIRTV